VCAIEPLLRGSIHWRQFRITQDIPAREAGHRSPDFQCMVFTEGQRYTTMVATIASYQSLSIHASLASTRRKITQPWFSMNSKGRCSAIFGFWATFFFLSGYVITLVRELAEPMITSAHMLRNHGSGKMPDFEPSQGSQHPKND
jgi:hypothetical protein